MSLVTQKKKSLAGGVNQQSAIYAKDSQVEEMENCVPTVDRGLRLRNPTRNMETYDLDGNLSFVTQPNSNQDAFVYEFDRGIFSNLDSELAFIITRNGGLEITDLTILKKTDVDGNPVLAATVYKDSNVPGQSGINYPEDPIANAAARAYLAQYINRNTFAMTTVKDTTFVVNKTVNPKMVPTKLDPDNPTLDYGDVTVDFNGVTGLNPETITGSAGAYTFTCPINVSLVTINAIATAGSAGGGGGGQGGWSSTGRYGGGGKGGTKGQFYGDTIQMVNPETISMTMTGAVGGGAGGSGGSSGGSSGNPGIGGSNGGNTVLSGRVAQTLTGGIGGAGGVAGYTSDGPPGSAGQTSEMGAGGYLGAGGSGNGDGGSPGGVGGFGAGGGGGGHGRGGDLFSNAGSGAPGGASGIGQVKLDWQTSIAETTLYKRSGYVWLKKADVTYQGYSYGCTITILLADGVTEESIVVPSTALTLLGTEVAAIELAGLIGTALGTRGGASADGSLINITLADADAVTGLYEQILAVESRDTFGDTASFGWAHNVDSIAQLPSNVGQFSPIVEVGKPNEATYWLHHYDGAWIEHRDPDIFTTLNAETMPHTITRRYNNDTLRYEFYVEQYEWKTRRVGDDDTNKIPSFASVLETPINDSPLIKDIFFYRNRMCFITERTIITSEVGEYGNFWRTTVAAQLDSDRIDAGVESVNAVNMEFAVVLEDSVIFFTDKVQFRFSGGTFLGPASYSIVQEMAYEINTSVRPIFMNDRIFFVAHRGDYSAVYEMIISNNSGQNSVAVDISSQCQTYIDNKIERLSGSAVDNTLFLTSLYDYEVNIGAEQKVTVLRNTVFMYKYFDNGRTREQSAWSKWTFRGNITAGFAIGKYFYLLIDRLDALPVQDWIMGSGLWEMDNFWKMDGRWIMSPQSLQHYQQFERIAINPQPEDRLFLDSGHTLIDGNVSFGEWVYGTEGNKDTRGSLQMKTVEIEASEESHLKIWVRDKQRDTYREIPDRVRVGRKPMVYGDSRNVRVGIKNDGPQGFRVEMVSYEGRINKRAKAK